MKKYIVLMIVLFGFHAVAEAQSYAPMVKEGKKWVYYKMHYTTQGYVYFPTIYEFRGDTVMGGERYKKLYEDLYLYIKSGTTNLPSSSFTEGVNHLNRIVAYFREEGSKVYVRDTPFIYYLPLVGCIYNTPIKNFYYEYIVYDWSCDANEWFKQVPLSVYDRENYFTFTDKTMIEINGTKRVCYNTSKPYLKMIEGIGYVQTNWESTLTPALFTNFYHLIPLTKHNNNPLRQLMRYGVVLSHVIEDEEIIYKGELYDIIQQSAFDPNNPDKFDIGGQTGMNDIPVTEADGGDAPYYDMQGHAVAAPTQPGIYIHNGQKVVVK